MDSNTGNRTPLDTRPIPQPQSNARLVPAFPGPYQEQNTAEECNMTNSIKYSKSIKQFFMFYFLVHLNIEQHES